MATPCRALAPELNKVIKDTATTISRQATKRNKKVLTSTSKSIHTPPLHSSKSTTNTKPVIRASQRVISTQQNKSNTTTISQTTHTTHQQFKDEIRQSQKRWSSFHMTQHRIVLTPMINTLKRSFALKKSSKSSKFDDALLTNNTNPITNNNNTNIATNNNTGTVAIRPDATAKSQNKMMQLYSKVDDRLVTATTTLSHGVKRKLPRGKIFFGLVFFIGSYLIIQNRIKRNSARWVNNNVINCKRSQAISLKDIVSLSRDDIFHVFQTIYPDLTTNGMLPVDRITHAVYDEIDDCRDDRKLAEARTKSAQLYFLYDTMVTFATKDKEELESEMTMIQQELITKYFPQIEFDQNTMAIKSLNNTQSALASANIEHHSTTQAQNTSNHPQGTNSALLTMMNTALEGTEHGKAELLNRIDQLAQEQRSLIGRIDLSPEQRQVQVGKIQDQLIATQHQLTQLEEQQVELRQNILIQYGNNHPTDDNHSAQQTTDTPEYAPLLARYEELVAKRLEATAAIAENYASKMSVLEELSPENQQKTIEYLELRKQAEQYKDGTLTGVQLDPRLMPTTEDFYMKNYFSEDSDTYKISTWTMQQLLRNLPTGTAGDDRYIKFHEAMCALALVTKTQWAPSDPHHHHYIAPTVLRENYLNVDRAFSDYFNDPVCTGGSISFKKFKLADQNQPSQQQQQLEINNTTNDDVNTTLAVPNFKAPSLLDQVSKGVSSIFTVPQGVKKYFTSETSQLREIEENERENHFAKLHYELLKKAHNGDITKIPDEVKFDELYDLPIENRLPVLGQIFERHHPSCKWDNVPEDVKLKIANRFQFLQKRKKSDFIARFDQNPFQPLSLAWTSMFTPDALPDTPQARNQYRRGLGNYEEQMAKVRMTLENAEKQPLSRVQFEKLIKTMCNAGHFKTSSALLTRTNNIWPIAYHVTSPKVIAQAYYDVLCKEADDPITLDEFHQAALHWGKVGRYNLWYYAPELSGVPNISGWEKLKMKWKDRIIRFCFEYTGIPPWLSNHLSNTIKGTLNVQHLELQNRFIAGSLQDAPKQQVAELLTEKNDLTLSQFSAHSRNVISSLNGQLHHDDDHHAHKKKERRDNANKKKQQQQQDTQGSNEAVVVTTTTTETSTLDNGTIIAENISTDTTTVQTSSTNSDNATPQDTQESSDVAPEKEKKKKRKKSDKNSDKAPISTEQTPADAV